MPGRKGVSWEEEDWVLSMARRRSTKTTRPQRDARKLVAALDGAEAKELLGTLLDTRPELAEDAPQPQVGAVAAPRTVDRPYWP